MRNNATHNSTARSISKAASVLLIIGGLNWGLVGLFNFDLVAWIFGGVNEFLAEAVYTLVGLAAIAKILTFNARDRHYSDYGRTDVAGPTTPSTSTRDRYDRVA